MSQKILIVDDDYDFLIALQAIIENASYEVIMAQCMDEGINKLKTEIPDLAILDIMMDTPNEGFELARKIRSFVQFKNMPIIILSSLVEISGTNIKGTFTSEETQLANAFLDKPVEPEMLIKTIESLLES